MSHYPVQENYPVQETPRRDGGRPARRRSSMFSSQSTIKFKPDKDTFRYLTLVTLSEFCGTVMFLFFAFGGVMVGKTALGGDPSTTSEFLTYLFFAALSFGVSLAVNGWIFYRVTGGLFNPAVTMAFVMAGVMHPIRGAVLFVAQLVGGIVAAAIIDALTPGPLSVANALGPNVNIAQGLFMEMFLTAELILSIFMLAVEKHRATYLAPIGFGSALFIGHIVGIYYTGAGLNPARSLGPCVVERSFPGYHWIYWVGPGLGAILATAFYKLLVIMNYYAANPDQDKDQPTDSKVHMNEMPRTDNVV